MTLDRNKLRERADNPCACAGFTPEEVKFLLDELEAAEEEAERIQNAWFVDETICPDGSLRPDIRKTIDRAEAAEQRVRELTQALTKSDSYLSLLRHRGGISWGSPLPNEREVDVVIGESRKVLGGK